MPAVGLTLCLYAHRVKQEEAFLTIQGTRTFIWSGF